MSFLLRVELKNTPGALGTLAAKLGENDVDIVSIQIISQDYEKAVDDLIVSLGDNALPDTVINSAQSIPGIKVLAIKPFHNTLGQTQDFNLLYQILSTPKEQFETKLVTVLTQIMRADWAIMVTEPTSESTEPKLTAKSPGAPETPPEFSNWTVTPKNIETNNSPEWIPELWRQYLTKLIYGPLTEGKTIIIGRNNGPAFLEVEKEKLSNLIEIIRLLNFS